MSMLSFHVWDLSGARLGTPSPLNPSRQPSELPKSRDLSWWQRITLKVRDSCSMYFIVKYLVEYFENELFPVSSSQSQGFFVRWVLIPLLRPKLMNMREMEKYLENECADIKYTIVRPPGLTNSALSGKITLWRVCSFIFQYKWSQGNFCRQTN